MLTRIVQFDLSKSTASDPGIIVKDLAESEGKVKDGERFMLVWVLAEAYGRLG